MPLEELLKKIIEKNRNLTKQGRVADYIPALSKANPNHIGVSFIDQKGVLHTGGEYNTKFTIQSISKVISLILAIMDNGMEEVFHHINYQATDDKFNDFIKLDTPNFPKPANPMINAGAIVTTSLVKGEGEEKFQRILDLAKIITKNPNLKLNEEVYLSEKQTGNRNRAMAYLMSSNGALQGDVEETLDTYFKQCSIEVDTVDLANMGKFISDDCQGLDLNDAVRSELTKLLKGILLTCGMYNYSSEYAVEVGIPSKSGVTGSIMGVIPRHMGIGLYSPPIDTNGNSVVGLKIIEELSDELNLNIFNL